MAIVTMKQLLESGAHFGHQTKRWNPKMKPYIYTQRNGIHVLDLHKSLKRIDIAYKVIKECVTEGGSVLFVGTKKQAQASIKDEAERAEMFYVNNRWLGGMLTNFKTISKRVKRLKKLEEMDSDGSFDVLPKKEVILLRKEMAKLKKNLDGIKNMKALPNIMFVIDVKKEALAIAEAKKLGITIIAIIDTNVDPTGIDHKIPMNDDAIRSIKLISKLVADACVEARRDMQIEEKPEQEEPKQEEPKQEETIKENISDPTKPVVIKETEKKTVINNTNDNKEEKK